MRLLPLLIFFALINFYASGRIIKAWPVLQENLGWAVIAAITFFVLQLAGFFGDHMAFPRWKKNRFLKPVVIALDWVSYLCFGIMSLLVVYGIFLDIVGLVWKWLAPSRNDIDYHLQLKLLVMVALTVVIGMWQALGGPKVKRIEIKLKDLPDTFDGFTIAQISDLHVGPTIGRRYAQKVVNMTNGLKADMIALTGDFVDGNVDDLATGVAPLAQLKAPDGVFFVTGNHEFYWDAQAWIEKFRQLGARVLLNEHEVIKRGGQSIVIAGILDLSAGHRSDPVEALRGTRPEDIIILLAHQPGSYAAAHKAGVDLQLSGHAHGGQYFPFSLVIRFFQKYHQGLNLHDSMYVYVSNGTGYWGPPLRTFVPAEITLHTLRRA
ncbi:MAG: metallophosphoesterase [Alphaproteobacteria bacterium]